MKIYIAEKPSVARDIAAILGANSRKDGYLEGNGCAVTWAFGHLIGLAMPQDYGITGFLKENLPILPVEFKLQPRQVKEGKQYKPDPGVMKQLKVIKELFNRADEIICCTDAAREGELIFRYIYHYIGCTKPFRRLWISSLTDQAIRDGLENLHPGSDYDNLYYSAGARAKADWVVGLNASNALSISAGHGVWSLGRVQTPTLAMICKRYLENKEFEPQTYFQIKLHTAKEATRFAAISTERFGTGQEADEVINRVRSARTANVVSVEKKEANQEPPLLYDLTTLQKEANRKYGFSADKTLTIAQSLYEKEKLISYPRTGSRYISDDVFAGIPALIGQLSNHSSFGNYAKTLSGASLNRRSVNNKKVTDHHALIITENMANDISTDLRIIYDMIAARMLEAFSGKCTKENTSISLDASGVSFSVKGSIILIPGWRAVLSAPDEEEGEDDAPALPVLLGGDKLPIDATDLLEKQTKPRPLHTEASLLSSMETCGKDLTDEAERESLKDSGIGTPATRAAIIETLFSREYIVRENNRRQTVSNRVGSDCREAKEEGGAKSLVPTNKGLVVYLAVRNKKIADVSMTGEWENALNKIASGEMDADTFHKGIEVYATQITAELLESKIEGGNTRESCPCPKCKNGQVVFYQKVAKCNNEGCGLTVFRNKSGKDLTDGQLKDLLTKGKTEVIKGFRSKEGKPFDASVAFDAEYKTVFQFDHSKKKKR